MDTNTIIKNLIRREGGFVDHPADRGGPTNYGITQQTLSEHRGYEVTVDDVRNLTEEEAWDIYVERYINDPNFHQIAHPALLVLIFDCAVQHGQVRAAMWLQQAAGVNDDGMVGPVTLDAVNSQPGEQLYRRVLADRCRFYGKLITRDPSQAAFAHGWANRVAEFIEAAP